MVQLGMRSAASATALLVALLSGTSATLAQSSVLRVVPQADLKVLDTQVISAQVTKIHALMIYDALFAWDFKLQAKPQMVETYAVSPDRLTYRFTLRPGLQFHDGSKVTTADVIASLGRWMKRDVMGQKLASVTAAMTAADERTFTLALKEPYGFVEFSLGSAGGQMPVIYQEKVAMTDAATPITTTIGSGPFTFNRAEWQPGNKIVYEKNQAYVPRSEAPDGLAGAKIVRVDRVEWKVISDPGTIAAAIGLGEVDVWDSPSHDLLPLLEKNKDVVVGKLAPFGNMGWLRPNALHPPFNDARARQALAYAFDQRDFMRAAYGDERFWKVCYAYFVCDAPWADESGTERYRTQDLEKAKQLFAEAGYKGEKLVLITTTELPQIGAMAQVAAATLKKIGVEVDLVVTDWGTTLQRMTKKDPPASGGWNMFTTWSTGTTSHHPLTNSAINMSCDGRNWNGWPCDEEAERLRSAFATAPDDAARHLVLKQYAMRLAEVQPYALLGQFDPPFVWRKNVDGLLPAAALVFWNVKKN